MTVGKTKRKAPARRKDRNSCETGNGIGWRVAVVAVRGRFGCIGGELFRGG
jgi:hypothetical protein